MQVLLEIAGNLEDLPLESAHRLVQAAKHYDKKYKRLSDDEILIDLYRKMEQYEQELDNVSALDSKNRGYQRNRMGENSVRKYLKGVLDLDRTTFICFLLFLGSDLTKPARLFIDIDRLNQILAESGFNTLNEYNDFDYFVINFLRARNPVDYLMNEVTRYALSEENFYLYKLYLASRSDDTDIRNLMKQL